MFKNVAVKRVIKKTVTPILTFINKCIPKNEKMIFLYSANKGIEHNLIPLRDFLINNNYQKKYTIICGIESLKYRDDYPVKFINKWCSFLVFLISKHVFYTTGQIPIRPSKSQIVIHLDHGTTSIKTGNLLTKINNGDDFFFTYYMAPSQIYIPVIKKEFLCNSKNIKINGEPVIDILYNKTVPYILQQSKKTGLWAPTFRQSDYLGYNDSEQEDLLPMFKQDDYEELNSILAKYEVCLSVKLHPAQNLKGYNNLHFSNLIIYSDEDFKRNGFELYRYMKQMDFMLADYSSVYLEYLLLNRPIGFVIPDLAEYTEKRGFIFEDIEKYMPGEKIRTKSELYSFIKKIALGDDPYIEDRKKVCDKVHFYQDGNNCRRCLEFSGIIQ